MTEIHPAPGQRTGEIIAALQELGLQRDVDFWPHYTWNLRPFIQTTPEAYEKWVQAQGHEPAADPAPASSPPDDEDNEPDSADDPDAEPQTESETQARTGARPRRTTKRGNQ